MLDYYTAKEFRRAFKAFEYGFYLPAFMSLKDGDERFPKPIKGKKNTEAKRNEALWPKITADLYAEMICLEEVIWLNNDILSLSKLWYLVDLLKFKVTSLKISLIMSETDKINAAAELILEYFEILKKTEEMYNKHCIDEEAMFDIFLYSEHYDLINKQQNELGYSIFNIKNTLNSLIKDNEDISRESIKFGFDLLGDDDLLKEEQLNDEYDELTYLHDKISKYQSNHMEKSKELDGLEKRLIEVTSAYENGTQSVNRDVR